MYSCVSGTNLETLGDPQRFGEAVSPNTCLSVRVAALAVNQAVRSKREKINKRWEGGWEGCRGT